MDTKYFVIRITNGVGALTSRYLTKVGVFLCINKGILEFARESSETVIYFLVHLAESFLVRAPIRIESCYS